MKNTKEMERCFVCKTEDYEKLREEYSHNAILLEEFAADFLNDGL